ncbi:MAG: hypothetical protein BGO69_03695 [Bacteroidetes bacterium 46-16]|nr:MAG: hypothetical protein BGO69_03695 [Bacteroidetes bacterium 46-16]
MRYLLCLLLIIALAGCHEATPTNNNKQAAGDEAFYSQAVGDSFRLRVQLPESYNSKEHYPVLYLTDANMYYSMMAATLRQYEELGAPPMILVGIGYKDFEAMDSLRNRDYTWPLADAKDSFAVSGGGERFLRFINSELCPYIERQYSTDTGKRLLLGHSLGGYFTMYALQQALLKKAPCFYAYIAASPSLHYHHYSLLDGLESSGTTKANTQLYVTYGGLEDEEDEEDADEPGLRKNTEVLAQLKRSLDGRIGYQQDMYSAFGHMDMAIPTFTKGLQKVFTEEE